jgi:hypothetical protein
MAGAHTDPTTMRVNRYIEEANAIRENLNSRFRMTGRNAMLGFIFCVAVPLTFYCGVKNQQVHWLRLMVAVLTAVAISPDEAGRDARCQEPLPLSITRPVRIAPR